MTFSAQTTVGELARRFPATLDVFRRHGVEFCCGGHRTLRQVCQERHVPYDALAAELSASVVRPSTSTTWTHRPVADLTAHLVEAFHQPLKDELPRLLEAAAKLQGHGDAHRRVLAVLHYELTHFASELMRQMDVEEQELFPLIERLASNGATDGDQARLDDLTWQAEAFYSDTGQTLRILRQITDGYVPPATACPTLRALYERLQDLEPLTQLHVHLERNELLARAAASGADAGVETHR